MSHMPRPGMRPATTILIAAVFAPALLLPHLLTSAHARQADVTRGSANVQLVANLPLGGTRSVAGETSGGFESLGRNTGDLILEQEIGRPFAYVVHRRVESGFSVINLSNPAEPIETARWAAPSGVTATDITYFRNGDRVYVVQAMQHVSSDIAAQVVHVTGVAAVDADDAGDAPAGVTEINAEGGFHHLFAYRHSNGEGYLFAAGGDDIYVYDTADLAEGTDSPVAVITLPDDAPDLEYGYHSMYVAWHAETETDRLYTAGAGGFYVFDITDVTTPARLATVSSAAIQIGHAISAIPDGSHIITAAGYRASPVRIFDLRPVFDGTVSQVRTAVGAWSADWRNYSENHRTRWPYVFTASFEDGLHIVNMMNAFEPYTAGYFDTWDGQRSSISDENTFRTGAWDVDVRNRDGLIAVTDANTGLWLLRMEEFTHWDGRGWGLPNVSSVQNWDQGPVGSTSWE